MLCAGVEPDLWKKGGKLFFIIHTFSVRTVQDPKMGVKEEPTSAIANRQSSSRPKTSGKVRLCSFSSWPSLIPSSLFALFRSFLPHHHRHSIPTNCTWLYTAMFLLFLHSACLAFLCPHLLLLAHHPTGTNPLLSSDVVHQLLTVLLVLLVFLYFPQASFLFPLFFFSQRPR